MNTMILALSLFTSLFIGNADAVNLTGTWRGVQTCPGVGDIGPFVESSDEGNFYILETGDGGLKAYAEFFDESFNGLKPDALDCVDRTTFALIKCESDACDILITQKPEAFSEIVVLTLIDADHFIGTSLVIGNQVETGAQAGNLWQNCTYIYERVCNTIPDFIQEHGCCGLYPCETDAAECGCHHEKQKDDIAIQPVKLTKKTKNGKKSRI